MEEIRYYVRKKLGVKDVKIYTQDFREVDANDKRVTGAVGIFVNPPSTGSALKDPVSYICTEGGGTIMFQIVIVGAFYHN